MKISDKIFEFIVFLLILAVFCYVCAYYFWCIVVSIYGFIVSLIYDKKKKEVRTKRMDKI
jgi:hypothetical protein